MVVTRANRFLALLFFALSGVGHAAVLPEDRTDVLYHSYDGGGIQINGPSILVRKGDEKSFSVFANYYADNITSASIDVQVSGASQYTENRNEYTLGVDYLHDKTTISFAHTTSLENDFDAGSSHFSISQDMFGDLTTISLGYSQGDDIIRTSTDPTFEENADRKNYRVGITQVLTKDLLAQFSHETITDEGFLNNPYRSVRYIDDSGATPYLDASFAPEIYPNTRTSSANAIRMRYYLPYRAAIHFEYRVFNDTWGIDATIMELGYTHPFGDRWIMDLRYRLYEQTAADFYSDLFPFANSQNFMARDKELSTYTDSTIGAGISYEFIKNGWNFIDKGSVNFNIDHIQFDYDDFRDARETDSLGIDAGTESLYSFSANVIRFFVSIWY